MNISQVIISSLGLGILIFAVVLALREEDEFAVVNPVGTPNTQA